MTQPKKILLLIPNLDFGGAQRAFSKLSLELAKKHEVYVAVFNTFEGVAFPYGGQLVDLAVPGSGNIFGKLYQFAKRVWRVRKFKRQHQIDVALSFLEGADYVNLLSKGRERTIISVRGSKVHDKDIKGGMGWFRQQVLLPLFYRLANHIVAVSEGIKEELVRYYGQQPGKIITIYNYYETEAIRELRQEPLPAAFQPLFAHPVIITSGRLHIQKNTEALIEIFARLPERTTHKLVILGDGELRHALLQKAEALGLRCYAQWQEQPLTDTQQVYFLGYQENPFRFISRSVLFAFPSSWEGFPNALAEAMICGIPVVSTDCPTGPREILAPGTTGNFTLQQPERTPYGYLMPLLDQEPAEPARAVWESTLHFVLQQPEERATLAVNAQCRMLDFSKEQIFGQWEALLTQA